MNNEVIGKVFACLLTSGIGTALLWSAFDWKVAIGALLLAVYVRVREE